jgi:2-dehydropantoate 2-reductase
VRDLGHFICASDKARRDRRNYVHIILIWQSTETHNLIRQTIGEAVAVAQARGIALNPALPEEAIKVFDSLPATYKPSLLVDLEQGRRLEIEAWNGALVRYGQQVGVSTPVNKVVYACLKPYANGRQG